MKNTFAFFLRLLLSGGLLSICICSTAQQYVDTLIPSGYYDNDHVFANMDLTQVPSGLLSDYALPITRLSSFNGSLDSTIFTSPLRCQLIYATLLSAVVNPNAQLDIAGIGNYSYGGDTMPYKILFYDYHRLKEDGIVQGLISVTNNQLTDISGS
jgi:hypothetical protein